MNIINENNCYNSKSMIIMIIVVAKSIKYLYYTQSFSVCVSKKPNKSCSAIISLFIFSCMKKLLFNSIRCKIYNLEEL